LGTTLRIFTAYLLEGAQRTALTNHFEEKQP